MTNKSLVSWYGVTRSARKVVKELNNPLLAGLKDIDMNGLLNDGQLRLVAAARKQYKVGNYEGGARIFAVYLRHYWGNVPAKWDSPGVREDCEAVWSVWAFLVNMPLGKTKRAFGEVVELLKDQDGMVALKA
jgi:hypothetical protein